VKTFPIKIIINTELFIDAKQGLYIQKGSDQEITDLLEEGKWRERKCGNENKAACLERLTLHGRKEKQMAVCLK